MAWIGSLQAFLSVLCGAVAGPLYDHGFLRSLVMVGSALLVSGLLFTSFVDKYWELIVTQGLMVGLGGGLLFLPGLLGLSSHFHSRLALAQGIATSGGSLGRQSAPHVSSILLTQFRRCDLSNSLQPIAAHDRLWMGYSNNSTDRSKLSGYTSGMHDKASKNPRTPSFVRSVSLARCFLYTICSGNIPRLCWILCSLLLRPSILHRESSNVEDTRLLFVANPQRRSLLRSHSKQATPVGKFY